MEDSHPDGRSLAGGAGQRPRFIPHIADRPSGHVLIFNYMAKADFLLLYVATRSSVRPSQWIG